MAFVIKDRVSKQYFARGGGFNSNINLAKQYANVSQANTTLKAELRNWPSSAGTFKTCIIVEVLLLDLSEVSDVQRPLLDDLLLVRKLEGA
jgi:hypothetical protein